MKVAGLCEAHYIDLMPHNPCGPIMTAANNHFAAAIPNYGWLEDRPEYAGNPDVFPVQPQRSGMYYPVDHSPGLGVEVNETWLEEAQAEVRAGPSFARRLCKWAVLTDRCCRVTTSVATMRRALRAAPATASSAASSCAGATAPTRTAR